MWQITQLVTVMKIFCQRLIFYLFFTSIFYVPFAQTLPPGGMTNWEINGVEEIVTFALFDPKSPGIQLPPGLKFIPASAIRMPQVIEYLKEHPKYSDWAFSIIEITKQKGFIIDGRALEAKKDGAIGLWLAPVDASNLSEKIPAEAFNKIIKPSLDAALALGVWVPDKEYVAYMKSKGHYGEYGNVTMTMDSAGIYRGEIRLDNLVIKNTASPLKGEEKDPTAGTQLMFSAGSEVQSTIVLSGSGAVHRNCKAEWKMTGSHPLSKAVLVGPTYLTTYEKPLKGSLYKLK